MWRSWLRRNAYAVYVSRFSASAQSRQLFASYSEIGASFRYDDTAFRRLFQTQSIHSIDARLLPTDTTRNDTADSDDDDDDYNVDRLQTQLLTCEKEAEPPTAPSMDVNRGYRVGCARRTAFYLINERLIPVGMYCDEHYRKAFQLLGIIVKSRASDAASISVSIHLFERLVKEVVIAQDKDDEHAKDNNERSTIQQAAKWLADSHNLNGILFRWKAVSNHNNNRVPSPHELLQRLKNLSSMYPNVFQLDIVLYTTIMAAMVPKESKEKAPLVVQALLDELEIEALTHPSLKPDHFTYAVVLSAWVEVSDRGKAVTHIQKLLDRMEQRGVTKNRVIYNLLLRFWSKRHNDMEKVTQIVQEMQQQGILLTMSDLSYVLWKYAQSGNIVQARSCWWQMINQQHVVPFHKRDLQVLGKSTQCLMTLYRDTCVAITQEFRRRTFLLSEATEIFKEMSKLNIDVLTRQCLLGLLMDMYTRAGVAAPDDIQSLLAESRQEESFHKVLLINAYATKGRADLATEIMKQAVKSADSIWTMKLVNATINAWAQSSQPDAVEQAFSIYKTVRKPSIHTFVSLMRCIGNSKKSDGGLRAESLLNEIERQSLYLGDNSLKADHNIYTLALRACYNAKDMVRAHRIMTCFEESETPPTVRSYNEILNYFAKLATPAAAERAEGMLEHLMKSNDNSLTPDCCSFAIVMTGWKNSGASQAIERMLMLYEKLISSGLAIEYPCFDLLMCTLCNSMVPKYVKRAELIFQDSMRRGKIDPDSFMYFSLMEALINVGMLEKATLLLHKRVEAYVNDNKPLQYKLPKAVDLIVRGWIVAGDLEKATRILNYMYHLHKNKILPEGPKARTYRALSRAWGSSDHVRKQKHMMQLARMQDWCQSKESVKL